MRKVREIVFVLLIQHGTCVSAGLFRGAAERRRTLRIAVKRHRVIVVPAHQQSRPLSDEFDHFRRLRAIIHQVSEHPQFVEVVREHL